MSQFTGLWFHARAARSFVAPSGPMKSQSFPQDTVHAPLPIGQNSICERFPQNGHGFSLWRALISFQPSFRVELVQSLGYPGTLGTV